MCFASAPKMTPPPPPVEATDPNVTNARDAERRRMRAAASKTILTSSAGVAGPATTTKSLLGQ